MKNKTLFSGFLKALGVKHTEDYSDKRFESMTFDSLFGLSHLLKDYGIRSEAWRLDDISETAKLTPPYLAQRNDGTFMIVREYDAAGDSVSYCVRGKETKSNIKDFQNSLNGIVMLAFPVENSEEPDYRAHAVTALVNRLTSFLLVAAAIIIFCYFFVTREVYGSPATILLAVLNGVGLWLSYMLMQKSLGIHTSTSEAVCGVLEKGGCDVITTSSASKLFGVFSWSEVGFAYFGVSLVTLLLFPHLWPALALCNICCLPYTVWSITYQKFVARHWCTLCVGVQLTLWLLFFSYLWGGFVRRILPLHIDMIVLVATYVLTVLFIHGIVEIFKNLPKDENNT